MSHYAIKLDLSKLKHVVRELKTESGRTAKVILLDVASNNIFLSDKGSIYLDLVAFENKEIKFDNTHSLKQSLSAEIRKNMTAEQIKTMPFLGNMKPIGGGGNSEQSSAPQAAASSDIGTIPDFGAVSAPSENKDPLDDLPF